MSKKENGIIPRKGQGRRRRKRRGKDRRTSSSIIFYSNCSHQEASQENTIMMANFFSYLVRLFPFICACIFIAICHQIFDYINHLHSRVTTISGHIRHLEKRLWSISSSWSITNISNVSCIDSSCWNITSSIKSIFNKMAGASASSQPMDIISEEQQHQASDVEQAASSQEQKSEQKAIAPLSPSITNLKPVIGGVEDENAAKIHIIYNTSSSDPAYNTPASSSTLQVYDSFGNILDDGVDVTSKVNDYSMIAWIHRCMASGSRLETSSSTTCRRHQLMYISILIFSSLPSAPSNIASWSMR